MRVLGSFMLIVGFVVYFWTTPQKGVSANELAQKNLQRMEANVQGSSTIKEKTKPDPSHIAKALKTTREQQMRYVTIIAMLLGVGFLLYSFIVKKEE